MCVNFTDIHVACPKDPYPLPDIDLLIDGSQGYRMLNIIHTSLGYNQIHMNPLDIPKTSFMLNHGNCYCNVIPFGHKKIDATFKRLKDDVFSFQIERNLEVYVNDMIVKNVKECNHSKDLEDVL